jgi:hypothetical protein
MPSGVNEVASHTFAARNRQVQSAQRLAAPQRCSELAKFCQSRQCLFRRLNLPFTIEESKRGGELQSYWCRPRLFKTDAQG